MADSPYTAEQVAERDRAYRQTWADVQWLLAQPGLVELVHTRLAELDRRYPRE